MLRGSQFLLCTIAYSGTIGAAYGLLLTFDPLTVAASSIIAACVGLILLALHYPIIVTLKIPPHPTMERIGLGGIIGCLAPHVLSVGDPKYSLVGALAGALIGFVTILNKED